MTNQSTLGPFMTLILTLTAKGQHADSVIHLSRARVVDSLLFAQFVVECLRQRAVGNTKSSDLAYRIGNSQVSRVSSQGLLR